MGTALSKASPYEQTFKTRQRRSGRPAAGEVPDEEPVFPTDGHDPIVARIAQRRAFAVVHEENKDELRRIYAAELRVLNRRDRGEVYADAGVRQDSVDGEPAVDASAAR